MKKIFILVSLAVVVVSGFVLAQKELIFQSKIAGKLLSNWLKNNCPNRL